MAETNYQKAISTDFTGLNSAYTKPDEDRFANEIQTSSIVTALESVSVTEASDQVDITFKDALSAGDQTTLSNLCAAHTGESWAVDDVHTPDKRLVVAPSMFREDTTPCYQGEGDDVTNGNKYGGTACEVEITDAGSETVEWQYITPVSVAGGELVYENALKGDYLHYDVLAPASPAGVSNPGAGEYNKTDLGGGAYVYTPAPSNDGDYDLSLTEKLNANVDFTKVVPVPSAHPIDGKYYFDWNCCTEAVTKNLDGTGKYNLFDFELVLVRFVGGERMLGDNIKHFNVPAYNAKCVLPHWKHKATFYRSGSGTLKAVWDILLSRKDTCP